MAFAKTSAQKKPSLACIGRVIDVGEAAATKSGDYYLVPIEIEGYGAARSTKTNFMFRGDWFGSKFNPESLLKIDGGSSLYFVFGKNIDQNGSTSVLRGIAGKSENFDKLAGELQALPGVEDGEIDPVQVSDTLRRVLVDEGLGNLVGYVLSQKKEDTGEVDENGNRIKILTPYYEIKEFAEPTQKWRDRQKKRAAANTDNSFRVTFTEDDIPY